MWRPISFLSDCFAGLCFQECCAVLVLLFARSSKFRYQLRDSQRYLCIGRKQFIRRHREIPFESKRAWQLPIHDQLLYCCSTR
eukprot:s414_g11.t1